MDEWWINFWKVYVYWVRTWSENCTGLKRFEYSKPVLLLQRNSVYVLSFNYIRQHWTFVCKSGICYDNNYISAGFRAIILSFSGRKTIFVILLLPVPKIHRKRNSIVLCWLCYCLNVTALSNFAAFQALPAMVNLTWWTRLSKLSLHHYELICQAFRTTCSIRKNQLNCRPRVLALAARREAQNSRPWWTLSPPWN